MAERLTRKIGYEYEKAKRETQLLEINNKLGKLEDILEKYGLGVEELDSIFKDYFSTTSIKVTPKIAENWELICDIMASDELNRNFELGVTKDRDTWKRACELACEREDDCYVYDNIHRAYEFYQQAKKDGDDE